MMPPLMTVGSRPPASSSVATIEVVVGLAVRAADGDGVLEAHQLGEHLGAAHDRQQPLARGLELGIVLLDRGRDDDDTSASPRFSADGRSKHLDALARSRCTLALSATGRSPARVAEIVQHLGDAAHADAADADEMHRHLHVADVAGIFMFWQSSAPAPGRARQRAVGAAHDRVLLVQDAGNARRLAATKGG
jgi:hypothetical protein